MHGRFWESWSPTAVKPAEIARYEDELDVPALVADGLTSKEVAARLPLLAAGVDRTHLAGRAGTD